MKKIKKFFKKIIYNKSIWASTALIISVYYFGKSAKASRISNINIGDFLKALS